MTLNLYSQLPIITVNTYTAIRNVELAAARAAAAWA
jgi:ABC-type proline/glycine betaine transport system permease subunit